MRKQTRRKLYKLVNPISFVLEGIAAPEGKELAKVQLRELAAIEAFRTGMASLQEWSDLCAMCNLSEIMGRDGVGAEVLQTCEKVENALIRLARQYETANRMTIKAEELQAMRDLYEYHDLQRKSITRAEYERYISKTTDRIKSKAPEVKEI